MYRRYTTGFKLFLLEAVCHTCCTHFSLESVQRSEPLLGLAKMNSEDGGRMREDEMLAYVSRQVGQKWSMLARYAGLEEDEIQQIKQSAQDRPRATMKKILERLTWNELLDVVQKHVS